MEGAKIIEHGNIYSKSYVNTTQMHFAILQTSSKSQILGKMRPARHRYFLSVGHRSHWHEVKMRSQSNNPERD